MHFLCTSMCVRAAGLPFQGTCIIFMIGGIVKILLLYSLEVVVIAFAVRHSQTSISLYFLLQHFLCCPSIESYHRIYK